MHVAHLQWLAEHDALAAVLQGLSFLARRVPRERRDDDLRVLRAMLVYLGDYPERVHHPREESELFARLSGRDAQLDIALEKLQAEHRFVHGMVFELEHQLNRAEFVGQADADAFAGRAERFVGAYHAHMQLEEGTVLPQAERLLTAREWDEIAVTLERERDPLHGTRRDAEFEALFASIVRLAPAPIGLNMRV
jgi:hemerythrin-like domain-containing protein